MEHQGGRYSHDVRRLLVDRGINITDVQAIVQYLGSSPGHWGDVRVLPTIEDYVAGAAAGRRSLGALDPAAYGRYLSEGPEKYK